jgi:hypothetical protein
VAISRHIQDLQEHKRTHTKESLSIIEHGNNSPFPLLENSSGPYFMELKQYKSPVVRGVEEKQGERNEKETGEISTVYSSYSFVSEMYLSENIAVTTVKRLSSIVETIILYGQDFAGILE